MWEVTFEKLELIGACRCYIKVPSKIKISILPQILLEMIENKDLLKITVLEFKEIYSMTVWRRRNTTFFLSDISVYLS